MGCGGVGRVLGHADIAGSRGKTNRHASQYRAIYRVRVNSYWSKGNGEQPIAVDNARNATAARVEIHTVLVSMMPVCARPIRWRCSGHGHCSAQCHTLTVVPSVPSGIPGVVEVPHFTTPLVGKWTNWLIHTWYTVRASYSSPGGDRSGCLRKPWHAQCAEEVGFVFGWSHRRKTCYSSYCCCCCCCLALPSRESREAM